MNKMKKYVIGLLLAGFILFAMTGSALAEEYYVSTNGDNSNDGKSMNNAFSTVAYGSSQLQAGDTLYIDGGTYRNDKVIIERSGTANNWITVTSYQNEDVLLQHDKKCNGDDGINGLCHKSYIRIEDIDFSDYGSIAYISGKYEGNTHHQEYININTGRTYERAFCCNAGASDMLFKDITIEHVEHDSSSPNAFDFLTSPHDENYKANSNYMIENIELINVDILFVEEHNGFNFGQGVSGVDYEQHWETQLCNNLHFDGCDVSGVSDQGYFSNKYILHNSVIENCEVSDCFNAFGVGGDNLRLENIETFDNDCNDIYLPWDTESYDIVIVDFDGDLSAIDDYNEVTIIESGSDGRSSEDDWMEEYIGEDSDEGAAVTIDELQSAIYHWINEIPIRDHLITTEELQNIIVLWQES